MANRKHDWHVYNWAKDKRGHIAAKSAAEDDDEDLCTTCMTWWARDEMRFCPGEGDRCDDLFCAACYEEHRAKEHP